MNIAVIGLGLMGASLAMALKGFRGSRITGADLREEVCAKAIEAEVVAEAWPAPREALKKADMVIWCLYDQHIPDIIRKNMDLMRPGLIMADICGVKSRLYAELQGLIPPEVTYVGLHPMAGKERDGYENADPDVYRNSGFIISPGQGAGEDTVRLMKEMAVHIGATRLAVVSPELQDEIIAYTSSLMHIASAGLCLDYHPEMTPAFTAGAFRDCTRVADINAHAWTELLMDNRLHAIDRLDQYIDNLSLFRRALDESDNQALFGLLKEAGDNKRKMLSL